MDILKLKTRLAKHGYICILWHIDDVKALRPELTDMQCMKVLEQCEDSRCAGIGINWEVIEISAAHLFPAPREDTI